MYVVIVIIEMNLIFVAMILCFTSLLTLVKSYRDNEWMIKKGSVQWSGVQQNLNSGPGDLITKTCLYNIDPLKPHFYVVKLGYTLFLLFLLKNMDCGYSLEPPHRGGSNDYPQSVFWAEIWKISEFFMWKIAIFWW